MTSSIDNLTPNAEKRYLLCSFTCLTTSYIQLLRDTFKFTLRVTPGHNSSRSCYNLLDSVGSCMFLIEKAGSMIDIASYHIKKN